MNLQNTGLSILWLGHREMGNDVGSSGSLLNITSSRRAARSGIELNIQGFHIPGLKMSKSFENLFDVQLR